MENTSNTKMTLVSKLTSNRTGKMGKYIAIYLISVGKENFENDAVVSAIKMIDQEFGQCYIVIADTLQRHNIATDHNISAKDAHKNSLQDGNDWLNRHKNIFKQYLHIPYKIVRWDSLINTPKFKKRESEFSIHINKCKNLMSAMQESISEYGNRLLKRLGNQHFKQISSQYKNNCFNYLQEECAAISLFPQQLDSNLNIDKPMVIVYPGKSTAILTANREIIIKKEYADMIKRYPDFLNWQAFRFNKIKNIQNKPQPEIKIGDGEISLDLEKINLVNAVSENQLREIEKDLDKISNINFRKILLNNLLNKHHESEAKTDQLPTYEYLANNFTEQLFSAFNALETKSANKCRANIIRILKKQIT